MFSGLNITITDVIKHEYRSGSLFLILKKPENLNIVPNTSVSVNGVYLPVRAIINDQIVTEAVQSVISKTTFGLAIPTQVSIEKALNPNEGISGHLIYGAIDAIGVLEYIENEESSKLYIFSYGEEHKKFIIKNAFVAIDGISCQILDFEEESFEVRFPHFTLEQTLMGKKKIGEYVNIEFDMMIRYMDKILEYKK
jgi:riboflavin synthase